MNNSGLEKEHFTIHLDENYKIIPNPQPSQESSADLPPYDRLRQELTKIAAAETAITTYKPSEINFENLTNLVVLRRLADTFQNRFRNWSDERDTLAHVLENDNSALARDARRRIDNIVLQLSNGLTFLRTFAIPRIALLKSSDGPPELKGISLNVNTRTALVGGAAILATGAAILSEQHPAQADGPNSAAPLAEIEEVISGLKSLISQEGINVLQEIFSTLVAIKDVLEKYDFSATPTPTWVPTTETPKATIAPTETLTPTPDMLNGVNAMSNEAVIASLMDVKNGHPLFHTVDTKGKVIQITYSKVVDIEGTLTAVNVHNEPVFSLRIVDGNWAAVDIENKVFAIYLPGQEAGNSWFQVAIDETTRNGIPFKIDLSTQAESVTGFNSFLRTVNNQAARSKFAQPIASFAITVHQAKDTELFNLPTTTKALIDYRDQLKSEGVVSPDKLIGREVVDGKDQIDAYINYIRSLTPDRGNLVNIPGIGIWNTERGFEAVIKNRMTPDEEYLFAHINKNTVVDVNRPFLFYIDITGKLHMIFFDNHVDSSGLKEGLVTAFSQISTSIKPELNTVKVPSNKPNDPHVAAIFQYITDGNSPAVVWPFDVLAASPGQKTPTTNYHN